MTDRKRQRGAALIIVLLLVATLSFILLSITNIVTAGVRRASAERARSELLWRAAAAEEIATAIIEKTFATPPTVMAPGVGLFAEPVELPFESGTGSIIFDGASECFNINSVVTGATGGLTVDPARRGEFVNTLSAAGIGDGEAQRIGDVVVDFLDTDAAPGGRGVEDGFYTLLPTPFRTADSLIASVSELRAMDAVTADIYRRVGHLLCANEDSSPSAINANMLVPGDAPIIAGLLGGSTLGEIASAIASRPAGGWASVADVPSPINAVAGVDVVSDRIEARVNLELGDHVMEEKLLFEVAAGNPKLLARTFGEEF